MTTNKFDSVRLPDELCRSTAMEPVSIPDGECTFTYSPIHAMRLAGAKEPLATAADRTQMLADLEAGEAVELDIDFRAFQQIDGVPNRNFIRFSKKILRKLSRSFAGMPFLKDHAQDELDARGGTIVKSKATPVDGGLAFDMTARLSVPWAVQAVLRGTLDRFSIGWTHPGLSSIECSECKCPAFTECSHLPGDAITDEKTGDQRRVEFVFTEAEGVEVSGVSVPAVTGTGITEIRTALSATAAIVAALSNRDTKPREVDMSKIAEELGLAADASEEAILAAVQARQDATKVYEKQASELRESNTKLGTRVDELEARDTARGIDKLFADYADRFEVHRDAEGELATHPREVELRALAVKDFESARRIVPTLAVVRKATPQLQSLPEHALPGAPTLRDDGMPVDAILAKQLEQLGITPEEYAKYGPKSH